MSSARRIGAALCLLVAGAPAVQDRDDREPTAAEQAIARAFPGCKVERTTAWLTDAERRRAGELAGAEFDASVVFPYVVRDKDGALRATAYFDTHRVRTLHEVLLVAVKPDGTVERIEVLAFLEPKDYLPRAAWYRQFQGRALGPDLELRRGIDGVSGATLTARATTDCARRVLAVHRVLAERAEKEGAKERATPEAPAPEGKAETKAKPDGTPPPPAAEGPAPRVPPKGGARPPEEPRARSGDLR